MDIFTRTALVNERWELVAEAEDIYTAVLYAEPDKKGDLGRTASDLRTSRLVENFARQDEITVLLARH